MFRRFISIVLLVAVMLCGCACSGGTEAPPAGSESTPSGSAPQNHTLSLLYCGSDSINPYLAATETNRQLSNLLYDPLIKIGSELEVLYILAESVVMNNTHCVINLKNVSFSDGTVLSAEDVIYSLNLAKKSNTRYAQQLATVSSATVVDPLCVSLILSQANPNFARMLDFPILKKHSDTLKDENNAALPPIGTGRYILDPKTASLMANPSYFGGVVNIQSIHLVNAPDKESISHHLEVGSVDLYYSDLADCQLPRMKGSSANVALQNMVYLGVNMKHSLLSTPEMRYALSAALNRTKLVQDAYYGYATEATGPFPSVWESVSTYQTIEKSQNTAVTVANLEKIGYNKKDADGFYVSTSNKRLSFTLLCNSENPWRVLAAEQVKDQLAEAGIQINIRSVTFAQYQELVSKASFELYIGEMRLSNDMDLTQIATQAGASAWGVVDVVKTPQAVSSDTSSAGAASDTALDRKEDATSDLNLAQTIAAYKAAQVNIADVAAAFASDMPLIPLCFRSGTLIYNSALKTAPTPTISDPFYGIESAAFQ